MITSAPMSASTGSSKQEYYVIPEDIMECIKYFQRTCHNFEHNDAKQLPRLNINDVHFDQDGVIRKLQDIFKRQVDSLQSTLLDDDVRQELHNLTAILEALEKRYTTIEQIKFEVIQKHLFNSTNCGNF